MIFFCFVFFWDKSLYVAQAGLNWRSSYLSFLSAGITGIYTTMPNYHQIFLHEFKKTNEATTPMSKIIK
jgi:hypothetical protein